MTIPRIKMPQVNPDDIEDLRAWLKAKGTHSWFMKILDPEALTVRQRDDTFFIGKFHQKSLEDPILISSDRSILDGHHRVSAHILMKTPAPAIQLSKPFFVSLDLLNSYPKVYHKKGKER